MKFKQILTPLLMLFVLVGCQSKQVKPETQLDKLIDLMSGEFNSLQQSLKDDRYFHISLKMKPIWLADTHGKWLYVEQAVGSQPDKPYRQRVYHVTALGDGRFSSAVYELPDPKAVIGGYETPALLNGLSPVDLKLRTGCAVILNLKGTNNYTGSTVEKDCLSQLRGATYATSVVEISTSAITSWDQGFDVNDEQVWGATAGPYVFDRVNTSDADR